MNPTFCLILLFILGSLANDQLTPEEIEAASKSKIYCGAKIRQALKDMCIPRIMNHFGKRTVHYSPDSRSYDEKIEQMVEQSLDSYYGSDYMTNNDENDSGLDNMIPNYIYSQLYNKRSYRFGIVDLCCKKSCPIQILLQFCPR